MVPLGDLGGVGVDGLDPGLPAVPVFDGEDGQEGVAVRASPDRHRGVFVPDGPLAVVPQTVGLRQVPGVVLGDDHALAGLGRGDVAVVGRVFAILGRGRLLQKSLSCSIYILVWDTVSLN